MQPEFEEHPEKMQSDFETTGVAAAECDGAAASKQTANKML
jgi:hypothetical protein